MARATAPMQHTAGQGDADKRYSGWLSDNRRKRLRQHVLKAMFSHSLPKRRNDGISNATRQGQQFRPESLDAKLTERRREELRGDEAVWKRLVDFRFQAVPIKLLFPLLE